MVQCRYLGVKNPSSVVNRLLSQRVDASSVGEVSQVWWGRINARGMLPIGEYTTTRDPPPAAAARARAPRVDMEESMGGKGGNQ